MFKKNKNQVINQLFCPDLGIQPGWEIGFGQSGNRSKFLAEFLKSVPTCTIIKVEDLDVEKLQPLSQFMVYYKRRGLFTPAICHMQITPESLEKLSSYILNLNLQKDWCSITVFKDNTIFLDSHDYMYDIGVFIYGHDFDEKITQWEKEGIITSHEWFEPVKK